MKVKVKTKGLDKIKRRLREVLEASQAAGAQGLYMVANSIMADVIPDTPLRVGALRRGAYVTETQGTGDNARVELGFGGDASDYAVPQHEETTWAHKHGKAKFLEDQLNAWAPRIVDVLAEHIRRAQSTPGGGTGGAGSAGQFPKAPVRGGKQ